MVTRTDQTDNDLLNIKQAAQLLNVSEISLRRWTDSGRLACLRIGVRRERRFRRSDLMAFPEQQTVAHRDDTSKDGRSLEIYLEGMAIDYGKHLCAFYETDLGRTKMAVPFLADGLKTGDVCFLVAAREAQVDILNALGAVYPKLDAALRTKRLIVSDGEDSAEDMFRYLERHFVEATRAGHHALRVLGDMAWFPAQGLDLDELQAFEQRYNHALAHRFPVVALCQYDVREFSGRGVLGALKCHEDTFDYPVSRFLGI